MAEGTRMKDIQEAQRKHEAMLVEERAERKANEQHFINPSKQGDTTNGGSQGSYSSHSKQLEFPAFNGEDPRMWIRRCTKYFNIANTITENQKVQVRNEERVLNVQIEGIRATPACNVVSRNTTSHKAHLQLTEDDVVLKKAQSELHQMDGYDCKDPAVTNNSAKRKRNTH
ncbi:hypothetical protein Salat_2410800 [Sesamum alatum]|uniref:Uncharacterized protein n=1 Tax=Sesamum alatum TaxID=300844 RepID=A0AAE1XXT4_9LAMI|nr:hypothetical protein Salat_2410800 [Sesamum alatum]